MLVEADFAVIAAGLISAIFQQLCRAVGSLRGQSTRPAARMTGGGGVGANWRPPSRSGSGAMYGPPPDCKGKVEG
jgi:hypothetical protein